MKTTMKGTIRGKTIELQEEPDLPDGQEVTVTVAPLTAPTSPMSVEERRAFLDQERVPNWIVFLIGTFLAILCGLAAFAIVKITHGS